MLIVALVLAVIGLVALVTAVVTTNEVIAWVCIAASALGVVLLIVDAVRERAQRRLTPISPATDADTEIIADDTSVLAGEVAAGEVAAGEIAAGEIAAGEIAAEEISVEDHPEEIVHDEPEYDTPTDDEPEYPQAAEESAMHVVSDGSDDSDVSVVSDDSDVSVVSDDNVER